MSGMDKLIDLVAVSVCWDENIVNQNVNNEVFEDKQNV